MAKIHQLSVFVENKLGHLAVPCRILADAGLNMVALSLADTVSYGILRIIVRDWEKAGATRLIVAPWRRSATRRSSLPTPPV